jgi:hypothetical protein
MSRLILTILALISYFKLNKFAQGLSLKRLNSQKKSPIGEGVLKIERKLVSEYS